MRSDSLHRTLSRLHRAGGAPAGDRTLEAELLARHAQLYPQRKGWIMSHLPRTRSARVLLLAGGLLALGIAACNAPTSYKADVGQALHIALDAQAADAQQASIKEMVSSLDGVPGVQGVSVNERNINGELRIDVMMWGQGLDTEAIAAGLKQRFPFLANGSVTFEPLEGTVEGNWGDRLGHELFEFRVDGTDEESIRQQIIEQLRAQGHEGPVDVDVQTEDGRTNIEVRVTEDQ
jgi:hypothetical protein